MSRAAEYIRELREEQQRSAPPLGGFALLDAASIFAPLPEPDFLVDGLIRRGGRTTCEGRLHRRTSSSPSRMRCRGGASRVTSLGTVPSNLADRVALSRRAGELHVRKLCIQIGRSRCHPL